MSIFRTLILINYLLSCVNLGTALKKKGGLNKLDTATFLTSLFLVLFYKG